MTDEKSSYILVAVALPLDRLYHYALPEALKGVIEIGHGVMVPFGARTVSGFVVEIDASPSIDVKRIKPVKALLHPEPLFRQADLRFYRWISDYYLHPLGDVIRGALPPGLLVSSRLTCRLTPAGRVALRSGNLEHPLQGLLEYLENKRGVRWQTLIRHPPVAGLYRLMREVEAEGWVTIEQTMHASALQPKQETWIRRRPGGERGARGRLQQRVLAHLGEEPLALSALKEALNREGQVLPGLRAVLQRLEKGGWIECFQTEKAPREAEGLEGEFELHDLNPEQARAVEAITASLRKHESGTHLLFGVTGSGKTEVYLRAVQAGLDEGRDALVLVPEIALTPQLVGRFQAQLGDRVLALHSAMPPSERLAVWMQLKKEGPHVLIGPRSILFAPMNRLGIIIVDEEHDASLKQDSGLRYSARDMAVVRGRLTGAAVVLGSATPALETFTNAKQGRYAFLALRARVKERALPHVTMVDMTESASRPLQEGSSFSPMLQSALSATLERGEQAILLLNRRGYAPFVVCVSCGGSFRCLHCDVSLTWHRSKKQLICHYCGMGMKLPRRCPHCRRPDLELMGEGTERLEHWLEHRFPGVRFGRLDRDSVNAKGVLAILEAFRRRETQVLVGTQMVVKGHDFPGVTLVGILNADQSLHMPDFRASERTFQLLTQVSGRAGRGGAAGEVYVQTCMPRHPALRFAAVHDYEGFYEHEMRVRRMHRYPPFVRLALVGISGPDSDRVEGISREIRALLDRVVEGDTEGGVEVLGPAPAPLGRIHRRFRRHVLVKAETSRRLHDLLHAFRRHLSENISDPDVRVSIDVDPQSLL